MTVPYASMSYATAYFGDRLRTGPWDNATVPDQSKALKMATRAIDNLNFAGHKTDQTTTDGLPNQVNQFPRGDDTIVPDEVSQACCELALALLDRVDPNFEIENLQNTSVGVGEGRISRDTSYVQEHIRAGIPSIQAYLLLKPFMRETQHPRIELHRGG